MQLLVIGPAFLDVVAAPVERLPQPGEELRLSAVALAPGGFAIAAVALRRLGIFAPLAAPIAEDAPGRYLRQLLDAEDVPCTGVAERTPCTIALNRDGDRAFLTAGFPDDADLRRAGMKALSRYPDCRYVHLSCRGPWAEEVARTAKSEGRFVSADCGTDSGWLQGEGLQRILCHADLYLPNAREAALATGASDPRDAAAALLTMVPRAIVKLGAQGVLAAGPSGVSHYPTEERAVTDATGAGDVFDAGYLAGLLYGFHESAAIRLGQYAAGVAIGALGGSTAAPDLAQAKAANPDLPWPRSLGGTR